MNGLLVRLHMWDSWDKLSVSVGKQVTCCCILYKVLFDPLLSYTGGVREHYFLSFPNFQERVVFKQNIF